MKEKTNETDQGTNQLDDEVFFAPSDDIKTIRNVIVNLETTHQELQKVAEGMRSI